MDTSVYDLHTSMLVQWHGYTQILKNSESLSEFILKRFTYLLISSCVKKSTFVSLLMRIMPFFHFSRNCMHRRQVICTPAKMGGEETLVTDHPYTYYKSKNRNVVFEKAPLCTWNKIHYLFIRMRYLQVTVYIFVLWVEKNETTKHTVFHVFFFIGSRKY